jgi:hypothetical protein
MSILDSMPHRCTIQRITRIDDELIGSRDIPVVEQTGVECWEQQVSAVEALEFEKRGMNVNTKVFFTSNPNVTEKHEIIITQRLGDPIADADQITMQVVAVPEPDATAGMLVAWRVMCYKSMGEDD